MSVSAIVVTRGDVDIDPVMDSIPGEWELLVWANDKVLWKWPSGTVRHHAYGVHLGYVPDLSVYGRYAAIEYASHDLIYVQDDDVIVRDPQAIVEAWCELEALPLGHPGHPHACHLVANMPQEFRHDFYNEHCLVGFGACFHRDAPRRAFDRYLEWKYPDGVIRGGEAFDRTCDVVFTALTPRVLVDVPKTDLSHATADNRMYRQSSHQAERELALKLALECRDA